MKSLNVKRIAAVAAGAAMIGSLAAPGLAVNTSPSADAVSSLVGSIKGHLDDVQVVLGSKGADIIDGISAAKIAAALAQADFSVGGGTGGVEGTDELTVTDKSVTVRTSGTAAGISPDTYDITYTGQTAAVVHRMSGANQFATRTPSTGANLQFLAPGSLGNVLSIGSVAAQYGSNQASSSYTTWTYREELNITNSFVAYSENDFPPIVGHGLFWNASDTNLRYSIVFDSRFPTGYNTNEKFQTTPKIKFLGHEFAIDKNVMNNSDQLDLYTGKSWIAAAGDKFSEFSGYEIEFVGAAVSSSNTIVANVKVTRLSDGAVEQRTDLQDDVGWPFFANPSTGIGAITVYLENVAATPSTMQAVVGTGQVRLRAGQEFTPDRRWYVPNTGGIGRPTTSANITFFSFVYGNRSAPSSDAEGRGNFQGTVLNGLKAGYVLNGPLQSDGTPKFTMQLLGFGGSRRVDTTELLFSTNQGTSAAASTDTSSNLPTIWVKYKDRDGLTNYLSPDDPFKVNFTIHDDADEYDPGTAGQAALFDQANLSIGGAVYTVINDKVVFLDSIDPVGNNNYTINFYIGGNPNKNAEAFKVTAGPVGIADNTTLTVGGVSGFSCTVGLLSATGVNLTHTGTCDVFPDFVHFGSATVIDARPQSMSLLYMGSGVNEAFTDGNWSRGGRVFTSVAGGIGTPTFFPYVMVSENSSVSQTAVLGPRNYTVLYDARSDINYYGAAETTPRYGLVVVDARSTGRGENASGAGLYYQVDPWRTTTTNSTLLLTNATTLNLSSNSSGSPLIAQDVDPVAFLESLKYHVDAYGTEFDASTTNELKVTHPEDQRDAVVRISGPVQEGGEGESVLREGDELSGVKIVRIAGTVGGIENLHVGGAAGTTVYTKGGKIDGARVKSGLVVLDSAATATYKVVVGGPWVNRLSEGMSYPAGLTQAAGNSYLHAEGNSLLVAGYTGSDTASAANDLVDLLLA